MMKKFVKEMPVYTPLTNECTNYCGGLCSDGHKCILINIGTGPTKLHAITNEDEGVMVNCNLGDCSCAFSSVSDFIENINGPGLCVDVTDFYMFDSLKEMLKWFAE